MENSFWKCVGTLSHNFYCPNSKSVRYWMVHMSYWKLWFGISCRGKAA